MPRRGASLRKGGYCALGFQQLPHPLEVLRRVHTGAGGLLADMHRNAAAVPQHPKLLQRFQLFLR